MKIIKMVLAGCVLAGGIARGADPADLHMGDQVISGPTDADGREAWMGKMRAWRDTERAKIKYQDAEYQRDELKWTQRSFIQPQAMVEDRYFYDAATNKYTVDRYLDDVEKRYGGIDSILLWPVYPNIGIDNRNQHDLLRDLPGGVAGVRAMIAEFHSHGVKVFFPAMPWDRGTRDEGKTLAEAAVSLMKEVGADGINGDTMVGFEHNFLDVSSRLGYPIALEPEVGLHDLRLIGWNTMTWGYWQYEPIPVVSKYKWIEPRHMINVCERWARNRTDGLQSAFFNGTGYESWENVWGIWNGVIPRDAEAMRRVATIERAMADLLVSPDWEPHVPTLQRGIYASKFPGKGKALWVLVSRTKETRDGEQLIVPTGGKCFDLWHGEELAPAANAAERRLSFEMEAHGYGAILITDAQPDASTTALLAKMKELSKQPLHEFSSKWTPLPQKMVEIAPTKPAAAPPEGMVLVPAATFRFKVSGIEIEGENNVGVDVQYPWEKIPRRHHDHTIDMHAFYIDRYPVTNEQFKAFLMATKYAPADSHNFLRDWKNGAFATGAEKFPVTWVSLEDARAYAAWAGKRLPHDWEWQYAAQGADDRDFPWGKEDDESARPKFTDDSRTMPDAFPVDAHPKGASPFSAMDMTGNVWQWTDEFQDDHTRAAVIRGGGRYRPKVSNWYFPTTKTLKEHGKYLLMGPSKDRSAGIGFRCVVDGA